jgi:mannose-6-phosphate isomerase-like protein (cupin superfamily)
MTMDVRATLRVYDQAAVPGGPGVTEGQTYQKLIGVEDRPTDRVRLGRATYVPGTLEQLHWHPIEALYYVISGHATVRDVEGTEYLVGPGSIVYAPAGLAGAHEWAVEESLELLDIRATNDASRKLQFTVDKTTLRSHIDAEELAKRDGIEFPSHY